MRLAWNKENLSYSCHDGGCHRDMAAHVASPQSIHLKGERLYLSLMSVRLNQVQSLEFGQNSNG